MESIHSPRIRTTGVVDQLTEMFHEEIRSGRWAVGAKIPVEGELTRATGAGRNAVREAVQSLVQAGLLSREQGRGTFVIADSQLTQTLSRQVARGGHARRDGLELRSAIDSAAAALAAERRDAADIASLTRLLAARSASWRQSDLAVRVAADTELHRAVILATHNQLFAELYEGLAPYFEQVALTDVAGDADPHADHHARLVQAVIDGDPAEARRQIERLLAPLIAE